MRPIWWYLVRCTMVAHLSHHLIYQWNYVNVLSTAVTLDLFYCNEWGSRNRSCCIMTPTYSKWYISVASIIFHYARVSNFPRLFQTPQICYPWGIWGKHRHFKPLRVDNPINKPWIVSISSSAEWHQAGKYKQEGACRKYKCGDHLGNLPKLQ